MGMIMHFGSLLTPCKHNGRHGGNGYLRIIAGKWRGRKLPIVEQDGLRPTPNRIRETLFNWLALYIEDARILDCFSGSGALALESLSRGASEAIILEKASHVADNIKNNLTLLSCAQGKVINTDSMTWLAKPADQSFDIIFLDPPFRKGLLKKICDLLANNGYASSGTIVYVEVEAETMKSDDVLMLMPTAWSMFREKIAGQIHYSLWRVG